MFDNNTTLSVKTKVSDALNSQIKQDQIPIFRDKSQLPKFPKLPVCTTDKGEKKDLADFVGSNSMFFLNPRLQLFFSNQRFRTMS